MATRAANAPLTAWETKEVNHKRKDGRFLVESNSCAG